MAEAQTIEQVLRILCITYREITFPDGIMYFCSCETGLKFDIFLDENGKLRAWRFIRCFPKNHAETHIAIRDPQHPFISFALEINDDREMFFRAEQTADSCGPNRKDQLEKMLKAFLSVGIAAEDVNHWSIETAFDL